MEKQGAYRMAKVLIIEDDWLHLDFLCDTVKYSGHTPIMAKNINHAAKLYNEIKIDLIITDIYLPGLTGLDFIKAIRSKNKNIPLIVVTGSIDDENEKFCIKLKVAEYIQKPVDPELLIQKINSLLD